MVAFVDVVIFMLQNDASNRPKRADRQRAKTNGGKCGIGDER